MRHATRPLQTTIKAIDKIFTFLACNGFYKRILTAGIDGNEDFDRDNLSCTSINIGHLFACKVYEKFFTRFMIQFPRSFDLASPLSVMGGKLGIAVTIRIFK
nr:MULTISPECIES: hypothetical protein [Sphingobacterium]